MISVVLLLVLTLQYHVLSQNYQQLSYANAELGLSLVRKVPTTPVPSIINDPVIVTSSTAEPSSLFSGIRNIFQRHSTTVRPATLARSRTTVPTTVGPYAATAQRGNAGPGPSYAATAQRGNAGQGLSYAETAQRGNAGQGPPFTGTTSRANAGPGLSYAAIAQGGSVGVGPQTTNTDPDHHPRHGSRLPVPQPHGNSNIQPSSRGSPNGQSTSHHSPDQPNPGSQIPVRQKHNNRRKQNDHRSSTTPPPELATDAEIEELTEKLFRKASPNLLPFITVNLQGRTRSVLQTDEAPQPLLTVNETILETTPTIAKLRALYDNYEMDTNVNEYVAPNERIEENEFLNAVLATPVMREAMRFLQDKGVVTVDPKTHFDLLKSIWFTIYPRVHGKVGSSGFEHVFMNERKPDGMLLGLHNWVWYYFNEGQSGTNHEIDYKGYLKETSLGDKGKVVKYRFSYGGINKPVNTMFVGTLPEFDMALYTVCFQTFKYECPVSAGGTKFTIRSHPFQYRGKRLVGSSYPEI